MGTIGASGLRRSSLSRKRSQRSIETIEAYLGRTIGGGPSNNSSSKRHLADKDWQTIMKEVWIKPTNGEYYFKKAHAVSYAMACVVHMNLLCETLQST